MLVNKDPVKTQAGRVVGGPAATKHLGTPTILVNLAQKAEVAVQAVVTKTDLVEVLEEQAAVTKVAVTKVSLTNLNKIKVAKTEKKRVAESKLPAWQARLPGPISEVK